MTIPRIELLVLDCEIYDPIELCEAWDAHLDHALPPSLHSETLPLIADPPPYFVLHRATDIDFSVSGDTVASGEILMIDSSSLASYKHHERLAALVGPEREWTIEKLMKLASNHRIETSRERLSGALDSGTWPTKAEPQAPFLQAAAFTHRLAKLSKLAFDSKRGIVWAFRDATPEMEFAT